MPSSESGISVIELLLVIVFQFGVCILLLAEIADATSGYPTLLGLIGYIAGGLTVVGSLLPLLMPQRFGLENN